MWLGILHNLGEMGLALWDLLGTSEQHFFFLPETLSTSGRHTMLVSFNNGGFNFFWHVPICNFGNKKRWCWCGRGVSVGSCDPMGSFNIFDDIFLWEILHIFWDFVYQQHFCVIPCHVLSDCFFEASVLKIFYLNI